MGFTVEDMMIIGTDRYEMEMVAGHNGWANSISWLMMVEDLTIISNFHGKELAVTTCLGFANEEKLMKLVRSLDKHHAAGLILNTGGYLMEVPEKVKDLCDELDLPLLTVPWSVVLSDMIKDLSVRIFLQGTTDEQISSAFIKAIEYPEDREVYASELLTSFDVDGTFQVVIMTTKDLDSMDSVERKRVGYRLQIYLEKISHNAHFFYYNGCFVLIINAVDESIVDEIVDGFKKRMERRMPEKKVYIGIGSRLVDISTVHTAYNRALASAKTAMRRDESIVKFDNLGVDRLLLSVSDKALLKEMGEELLAPVLEYDKLHDGSYEETLYNYLKYDGSIQAVGNVMYIHRNTITYRMNKIRELLNNDLASPEDRIPFEVACRIIRL